MIKTLSSPANTLPHPHETSINAFEGALVVIIEAPTHRPIVVSFWDYLIGFYPKRNYYGAYGYRKLLTSFSKGIPSSYLGVSEKSGSGFRVLGSGYTCTEQNPGTS